MNYLLKPQASPCHVVESLLNSRKNNTGVRLNSTYISALKIKLQKKMLKRHPKKNESSLHIKESDNLKIMSPMFSSKSVIERKKLPKQDYKMKDLNSRYNVDCTKSYDPILLNCNLEVEELSKTLEIESLSTLESDDRDIKTIKNQIYPEPGKDDFRTYSNLEQRKKPCGSKSNVVPNPQPNTGNLECLDTKHLLRHQTQKRVIGKVPLNVPEGIPQEQEEKHITPDNSHEKFTEVVTSDYSFGQFVHSVIDICATNNMIQIGYKLFINYRRRMNWKRLILNNPKISRDIYTTLLYALATKGYWNMVVQVTRWMKSDGIKFNQQSFAAMLYCLVQIKDSGGEKFASEEIPKVLNMIFRSNVPLHKIFVGTQLEDKSEKVLELIRQVIPSFEIKPETMELSSDCCLLKNLHKTPIKLQPQLDGLEVDDLKNLVEEQLLNEKNFYIDVKAVSSGRPGEVPKCHKEGFANIRRQWRTDITRAIISLQRRHRLELYRNTGLYNLHLYFTCLPASNLVDILMETTQSLVKFSGGFSPSCEHYQRSLGLKVYQCYQLKKNDLSGYTDKTEKLFREYVTWYTKPSGPAMNSRQQWQMIIQEFERLRNFDVQEIKWPDGILIKLGKLLLNTILAEAKFTVRTKAGLKTLPAMYTILRCRENRFREEIKCHPILAELIDNIGFDILHYRCEEVPMVCPPKPWKDSQHGGYLFLSTDFIRKPGGIQGKVLRLKDMPVQKLYATLDSLNALQTVPWMINEDVLDVALKVFRMGGSEKLNVPLLPQKPPSREKFSEEMSYEERRMHNKRREEVIKQLENNYSLWCEALYRLSLANHFRKRILWMPQNCDFRGRVYPVPPLVNHMGSDLYRSLLVFAKGKPLGPKGLDWLKIHLINLTGTHKRRPVKERLDYANEILPDILDSADKPLTGNKWWTKSEEPWQTLSACMEVKKALSNPNPEMHISRFPIHQDGSCNGLQHYAALGKDLIGAQNVNLVPYESPQDVYSVVAELVEQERAKDASSGVEMARALAGFVERKVVKQTIMTTVYGVTLYGARLQIAKRLEEIPNFPREKVNEAALYLAQKTFFCLGKMFTSAKKIQDWFILCAQEICNKNEYVQWRSPLDFPVLQPYAKSRLRPRKGSREIVTDTFKQKNAFPPNFIHSLDSCHMMLTSLYCEQAGLTFAAVHDCFWTHPSSVEIMNRICREQFISLHLQPILEDLSKSFKETYRHLGMTGKLAEVFEAIPEKGSFDVRDVLNSVYFFS